MPVYAPTVIPLNAPFDGDVVDANFDEFQTATGSLAAANFAATNDLEFRNLHIGASSETFIETGSGTTAIYNAFARTAAGPYGYPNPYPDGHNTAADHQPDTEVSFVAKADGVAHVTSTASLYRPKAGWVSAGKHAFISAECHLAYQEGLSRYIGPSVFASPSNKYVAKTTVAWSTGKGTSERMGQEIRLTGQLPIVANQRYSFWLNIRILAQTINEETGVESPDVAAFPLAITDHLYMPNTAYVVSIKGGSRHTAVTCIYR